MTVARSRGRRLARAIAFACVLLLSCGALALPAATAGASSRGGSLTPAYRAVGPAARLPAGDRVIGAVPAGVRIRVDVVLRPAEPAALDGYALQVSSPRSRLYRHYLSTAAFRRSFAPAPSVLDDVERQLRQDGLRVLPATADGLVIPVEADAARMQVAFRTTLFSVRLASGGLGMWTRSAPEMPANTAGQVLAVLGLDTLVRPQPLATAPAAAERSPAGSGSRPSGAAQAAKGGPKACRAASLDAAANATFTDDEIAHAYGFDGLYSKGILGSGQTVGLFEEDVYATSDLEMFDECYLGSDHTDQVSLVNVDEGEPAGVGGGEATLDVEDVSAYAPGAHIDVYDAPSNLIGWVDEMAAIVNDDAASVVNVSYGLCEAQMQEAAPGLIETENLLFEQAALQGQTFVVASGDSGSETCFRNDALDTSLSVSDPASQPFALSVGGTSLLSASFPPAETVWNDGGSAASGSPTLNGAGGGGISQVWPMPAWQAASGVPGVINKYSSDQPCGAPTGTDCREVPDVTASADELHGDTIVYGGSWGTIGGTSAAAPKWAALLALVNNYCGTQKLGPVGFVTPALYQIASNPVEYAEAFNDITKGDNDVTGTNHGAYPATAGYDLASGLGSPRATGPGGSPALASLLCSEGSSPSRPSVTTVAPVFGTYEGGTAVTILGSHLAGVTQVQFGSARVAVHPSDITADGTEISVVSPPSPRQPFDGGVPVGGVLVAVSGPSGTSAPNPEAVFHYVAGTTASPTPSVFYITPSSAPAGTTVDVYGSGFAEGLGGDSAPTVRFGGIAASGVTVVSDTELEVTVPPEQASTDCATQSEGVPTSSLCQTEVTVTNEYGTSAVQQILPVVSGLVYDLFVPSPGTENVPAVTEFDYAPTPVISSVDPDAVGPSPFSPSDPFTPDILTITGTGFNYFSLEAVEAIVPGEPSLDQSLFVGVITPTTVEFEVPVFAPGGIVIVGLDRPRVPVPASFELSVESKVGTSNVLTVPVAPADITVTSLSQHDGTVFGGTTVTATGTNLTDATGILYNGSFPLFASGTTTDMTVLSPTRLRFVTPPMVVETGYFEVCDATVCAGPPQQTSFAYFYPVQPVVEGISPASGSEGGGEVVTITGTGLGSVTAVRFGATVTTQVGNVLLALGESTTEVLAVVPPRLGKATVPITVVTLAGTTRPAPVYFRYRRGAPGPPLDVAVQGEPGMGVVSWKPPRNDGGSPVLRYVVSAHTITFPFEPPPQTSYVPSVTVPATARRVALPVTPYTPWSFSVRAETSLGSRSAQAAAVVAVPIGNDGYAVAAEDGTVLGYGDLHGLAPSRGGTRKPSPVVGMAVSPTAAGYWTVSSNGLVEAFGDVTPHGSLHLRGGQRVVAIVADPVGEGYWLVTSEGRVFAFGKARPHGGVTHRLASPIVAAAAAADGEGYWLVDSAGRVFAFGSAKPAGSLRYGRHGVVAIMADPASGGYWLVTSAGRIYAFGRAFAFRQPARVSSPVIAAAPSPNKGGCWLLESDGAVLAIGSARPEGSPAGILESPAVDISA